MKNFTKHLTLWMVTLMISISVSGQYFEKSFPYPSMDKEVLMTESLNGFIVAGIHTAGNNDSIVLMELDTNGSVLWSAIYSSDSIFGSNASPISLLSMVKVGNEFSIWVNPDLRTSKILSFNSSGSYSGQINTMYSGSDLQNFSHKNHMIYSNGNIHIARDTFNSSTNQTHPITMAFDYTTRLFSGAYGHYSSFRNSLGVYNSKTPNHSLFLTKAGSSFHIEEVNVSATPFAQVWTRQYAASIIVDLIPVSGGYLLYGSRNGYQYISKLTDTGDTIWEVNQAPMGLEPVAVVETNGDFILAANSSNGLYLTKISATGNLIWQTHPTKSMITEIIAMPDGGIVGVGRNSNNEIVFLRTDEFGNICPTPGCVWPGDTDNDGIANNNDLLKIGLGYNATGPARADQTITWDKKSGMDWDSSFPSGLNYRFADANGDGIIDSNDIDAILQNYGLTHNKMGGGNSFTAHSPLYIELPGDTLFTGDTVTASIFLGTAGHEAENVYGLAFTISADPAIVDENSLQFTNLSSWLGVPSNNTISLYKNFPSTGQTDIAISRIDRTSQTGFGKIGEFSFILQDNIDGKTMDTGTELTIHIGNVKVISHDGSEIQVAYHGDEATVLKSGTSVQPNPGRDLLIYPNPAKTTVFLEYENIAIEKIIMYDLQGKEIPVTITENGNLLEISLIDDQAGIFILSVISENGVINRKIYFE